MSAAKYNQFIFRAAYSYAPCGETTASGDVFQPFRRSSEFDDEELGLVYYNYPQYVTKPGVSAEELRNRYCQIQSAICECIENNKK